MKCRAWQADEAIRPANLDPTRTIPQDSTDADRGLLSWADRPTAKARPEPRPLRRKAIIPVEFDAEDYLCAQTQEAEIRRLLSRLQADFKRIDIRFADRRPRLRPRAAAPQATWPRP